MNKRDYFIEAIKAGALKRRSWLNAVFSFVVRESPNWDKELYPFKTKRTEEGVFFVDPARNNELTQITDAPKDAALFGYLEPITLTYREIENNSKREPLLTTYGNVMVNQLLLVLPFGRLFEFQTGVFNIKGVEKYIAANMIDNPLDTSGEDYAKYRATAKREDLPQAADGKLYVHQYLHFADNAFFLKSLSTNNVQSTTPKSLHHHPRRNAVRAQLMEQYKEQLTDPAIIAAIGLAMEELDREWLKGDPAAKYYSFNEKKFISSVRKKLFYMFGGESPFEDGTSVEFISKSLQEGIDTDHMPVMNNSLRYGSYNRGNQTMKGGETTKTIYRMLGTVTIKEPDCGTTIGLPTLVSEVNKAGLVGLWILSKAGESILLTAQNIDRYVNTLVDMRGPMTCKTGRNDTPDGVAGRGKHVCEKCAGVALSEQPGGMAAAAAGVGGRFLSMFLSKMHSTALKTVKWDYRKHLH